MGSMQARVRQGSSVAVACIAALFGAGCAGEVVSVGEPGSGQAVDPLAICAGAAPSPLEEAPPAACTALAVGRWLRCDGPSDGSAADGYELHADGSFDALQIAADQSLVPVSDSSGFVAWQCAAESDAFVLSTALQPGAFTTNAPRFSADARAMRLGIDPYFPTFARVE